MTDPRSDELPQMIVQVGGASRAARAIKLALPGSSVRRVTRGGGDGDLVVDDYRVPPDDAIPSGAVVINCVGTAVGDPDILDRLNRNVPIAWASAACAAGAAQFIQLSSFSVYGNVERVDAATQLSPASEYGRSKLAAEQELATQCGDQMALLILRLPILVGEGVDKLAQLLGLIRRLRVVPKVAPPISRSMLSYDTLGLVVARAIAECSRGIQLIADPEPFSYEMVAEEAVRAGKRLVPLPIPGFARQLSARIVPELHQRLFTSMVVASEVNSAGAIGAGRRVRDIVAAGLTA